MSHVASAIGTTTTTTNSAPPGHSDSADGVGRLCGGGTRCPGRNSNGSPASITAMQERCDSTSVEVNHAGKIQPSIVPADGIRS
jgi:hypothetical protein